VSEKVKIYGERNTGTNYLSQLLQLNLEVSVLPGVVPGHISILSDAIRLLAPWGRLNETLIDHYFKQTYQKNLGWKHALLSTTLLQAIATYPKPVYFITMTKNPYSWLLSLHNNPYHVQNAHETFEEFLTEPWVAVGREHGSTPFDNPIEMWNRKNASYLSLGGIAPALNIRYEDVLANPAKMVGSIAAEFNLPNKSKTVRNIQASTKEKEKDFSYYQHYYLDEVWKKELNDTTIAFINTHVDKKIMAFFNYMLLNAK